MREAWASEGPDSVASWVVAGACCFINVMMFGMSRLSGVLFVASMPWFDISREEASFAYTFANFTRNLSGPLVGYIGHKLGVRNVTTFGGLLAAIGVGTCFFATNINTITILWGAVFGLGFGLGNILLPVKINQYFDKHRATASGIAFSGACIGSFVLPPIVEILLNTYGLSGTFLILSGLVLNCVPAALLLRKPDFTIECDIFKRNQTEGDEKLSITSGRKVKLYTVDDRYQNADEAKHFEGDVVLTHDERMKRLSTQTLVSNYAVRLSSPDVLDVNQILENSKGRRQVDQDVVDREVRENFANYGSIVQSPPSIETKNKFIKDSNSFHSSSYNEASMSNFYECIPGNQSSKSLNDLYTNQGYLRDNESNYEIKISTPKSSRKNSTQNTSVLVGILTDPVFLMVALTNALYCFTFICMITVIVDYARDLNIGESNEKYVLMSLSVGDIIGRLGLGWITDRGYMSRTGFASFCFMFQGVITAAMVWASGFANLLILSTLYGLSEAGIIVIFPLIIAQYLDEDKQTVAISSIHFLAGPLCLTVAPLIGFFRDQGGSYDYIFFGIGMISAFCCIVWLLTPCILKCKKKYS